MVKEQRKIAEKGQWQWGWRNMNKEKKKTKLADKQFGGGGRVKRVTKNWVQISVCHSVPLELSLPICIMYLIKQIL